TKVRNTGASWVSVTPNNAGKTQVVGPGSKADFPGGPEVRTTAQAQAQAAGSKGLSPPALLSPSDREKVKLKPSEKGPGQVVLSWTPVAGAREYEVEFTVDSGKPILLKAPRAEVKLPPIPAG